MTIKINDLSNSDVINFLKQTLKSGRCENEQIRKDLVTRVNALREKISLIPSLEVQIQSDTQRLSLCLNGLSKFKVGKKNTSLEEQYFQILQGDVSKLETSLKEAQDNFRALSELKIMLEH